MSASTGLLGVDRFMIPESIVEHLYTFLRETGLAGHEGVGFWVGRRDGEVFHVLASVIPSQQARRMDEGGVAVVIPGDELHRLNVWLYQNHVEIGVQVHSHPDEAYHSDTDDALAVATRVGAISLVVPRFAADAFDLAACAAYRLSASGIWEHVTEAGLHDLIHILPET